MNYVIAAWSSCAAILIAYAWRISRRERTLGHSLGRDGSRSPEDLSW